MSETPEEAQLLAQLSSQLLVELAEAVPGWVERSLALHAGQSELLPAAVRRVNDYAVATTIPEIGALLGTDIDQQSTNPLELVRSLVPLMTQELVNIGAAPIDRDPGSVELLPNDVFGLTPAGFAEIDPSLSQPGLAWGAAKAHVHLKRHTPVAEPDPVPTVVVFAPDLGDRSRFDGYVVRHIRSAGQLSTVSEETELDLIIVDLDRTSAPGDFFVPTAHVVGFGSHVDTDRHEAAIDAGFDAVMARSVFFRRMHELLAPVAKNPDPSSSEGAS